MSTVHIEAGKEEIAKVVLMPGDPLRAKFIALKYLENVKRINKVRNMLGYTGYYKGKKVTVMGSGMGIPSIGIYAYELFKFYQVDKIIRLGSCGGFSEKLKLHDVILVERSYSNSSFAKTFNGSQEKIVKPANKLNKQIKQQAVKMKIPITKATVLSSDAFYNEEEELKKVPKKLNCIAAEMEAFGLFQVAKTLHKEAACLLTVVRSFITNESASSLVREKALTKMIELALESL